MLSHRQRRKNSANNNEPWSFDNGGHWSIDSDYDHGLFSNGSEEAFPFSIKDGFFLKDMTALK